MTTDPPRTESVRRARPRRADAERNIEAIVRAGLACFTERPDVSMTSIAQAAGVSRVTLYTHFPTREELLVRVLDSAVAEADRALAAVDDGPADEVLSQIVRSSWDVLGRYRNLMLAAEVLTPQELRGTHRLTLDRIARLVVRGQAEGTFRDDLGAEWIVTIFYSLVHSAALEVTEGRMSSAEAADALDRTLRAAITKSPQ
ncbi:hypothetical protein ALI22I_02745 [Saccharothrix sp. ALI-22-I]|uniref:TetR/AcrR family transcriptional regulator n=1 Tax=Saccharothrix sp. ALI-22-I TaxID=1933778 RepID=UPI00097CA782|nr:TetR/AcrR family transcriptional regulator [Saccharothrix sp. ALI-22-I]ONI92676.1 hypothetical protein ALI22I_02745 [Saccharothrix sp. ALI-22-I]